MSSMYYDSQSTLICIFLIIWYLSRYVEPILFFTLFRLRQGFIIPLISIILSLKPLKREAVIIQHFWRNTNKIKITLLSKQQLNCDFHNGTSLRRNQMCCSQLKGRRKVSSELLNRQENCLKIDGSVLFEFRVIYKKISFFWKCLLNKILKFIVRKTWSNLFIITGTEDFSWLRGELKLLHQRLFTYHRTLVWNSKVYQWNISQDWDVKSHLPKYKKY